MTPPPANFSPRSLNNGFKSESEVSFGRGRAVSRQLSDVPLNVANPIHSMARMTFPTPVDVNLLCIRTGLTPLGEVAQETYYEQRILKEHAVSEVMHSSGCGGVGNITRSRSRSCGPGLALHSTGWGGDGTTARNPPPFYQGLIYSPSLHSSKNVSNSSMTVSDTVIVVSGEAGRKAFFTNRGFDLTEGFKIPVVKGVTSDLQTRRVALIHKRLSAAQRQEHSGGVSGMLNRGT
ncbi:hypothetical protein EDD15DRAFT_2198146 [Pisolithus albus]|nr:hypothetical protein EDD15DRAFT_2198146 [Pisolithus albus]